MGLLLQETAERMPEALQPDLINYSGGDIGPIQTRPEFKALPCPSMGPRKSRLPFLGAPALIVQSRLGQQRPCNPLPARDHTRSHFVRRPTLTSPSFASSPR